MRSSLAQGNQKKYFEREPQRIRRIIQLGGRAGYTHIGGICAIGYRGVYIGSYLSWLGARGVHCARAPAADFAREAHPKQPQK